MATRQFTIENNIIKGEKLPPLPSDARLNEVLLEKFKNNSEFIAQIEAKTGETWTYKELIDNSVRCALWMKREGIKAGDIVAICSHNHMRTVVPLCAGFFIGANINPWFWNWTPEVAVHYVNLTKPKIVFANENAAKMLKEVFRQANVNTKIVVFGKLSDFDSFDDIIKDWSAEEVDNFQCYPVRHEDSALLIFSSGSSGMPKAIQHSYRSVHCNVFRFSKDFGIKEKYVVMQISSIFWMTGFLCNMYSLLNAYQSIIMNSPSSNEICEAIQKYKVQWVVFKAAYLNELYKSGALEKYDFSSVEVIATGGSQVHPDSTKNVNSVLKNGEALQGYGMTEIGTIATLQNKGHNNHDSCGVICYDVDMKIIDVETKKILGPNERGEIYLKQDIIMDQYYNNPEATAEAIDKDGWYHTGDVGYFDKDGNIFVVDRLREMIKCRGDNVYPAEIENYLLKHPKVFEVAVVPVPHPVDVEHPVAFISTVDNVKVSEEELFEMVSVLGKERKLHGGIKFLDKLPETATGKIDRMKLKKMARASVCE